MTAVGGFVIHRQYIAINSLSLKGSGEICQSPFGNEHLCLS